MGQEKPFQERRKYMRLQANVEVKYMIIGKPGTINVFSKNISAGGLCITAGEQITNNTPLQLEIKIPDLKDPIRAIARVVWQKKFAERPEGDFTTGIEFTGISDFDRFNINRYVTEHTEPAK